MGGRNDRKPCIAIGVREVGSIRYEARYFVESQYGSVRGHIGFSEGTPPHGLVTTLTTLGLEYYRKRWHQLIGRGGEHGIVLKPAGEPLPKVLQPGEQWSTIVSGESPVEKAREHGLLVCAVYHTMSKQPTRHVVRFVRRAGNKR